MVRLWTLPLWGLLPVLTRGEGGSQGNGNHADVVRRQSDAPGADSYRLRAHHKLAVLGDYLYIVGGEVSQLINQEEDTRTSRAVNSTLSIPLNEEWTNSTVSIKTIDSAGFPAVKNPGLWIQGSEDRLYSWAGEGPFGQDETAKQRELWVFDADGEGGGEWSTRDPSNRQDFIDTTRTSEGGCATCGGTGYCLGGTASRFTDADSEADTTGNRLVEQLVSLDMESMEWKNEGAEEFNQPYGSFQGGEAVCGAAGEADPVLLFLGGEAYDDRIVPLSTDEAEQMQFFNLTWLDPGTGKWHWQRTSGDTPPARSNFCATGIRSSEGTYDVFVYGGHKRYGGSFESLSDIYVLSIPAFRWFSVDAKGTPRSLVDCAATESGQVIVVGGLEYSETGSSSWWAKKDPWPQGLGVFDLHSLKWSDRYNPDAAPYKTPDVIRNWYDDGGLEDVDWSSDEVESMFAEFKLSADGGDATIAGGEGGSGDSGDSDDGVKKKKPIGAIVGGTIGGMAGVAILVGLAWWVRRSWRSTPAATGYESPEKNATELESPNVPQEVDGGGYPMGTQELDGSGYRMGPAQELEAVGPGASIRH